MPKEIRFNPQERRLGALVTYTETLEAIERGDEQIETVQMALLSMELVERGYRVFVVDKHGEYEIGPGGVCPRTDKDLRLSHDIEKMWKAGSFDL